MTATKRIFYSLFFCLLLSSLVYGQTTPPFKSLKPSQLKNFAKNSAAIGDHYSAIKYYERYLELKSDDAKVMYLLAEAYRNARDYKQAEQKYKEAYKADDVANVKALFYWSQMQKVNGKCDSAQEGFMKFKKAYKDAEDKRTYRKLTDAELAGCEMTPAMIDTPLNVVLFHLDTTVNKAHIEFSPLPVDESTLIYASFRADSVQYIEVDEGGKPLSDTLPVRKFYTAQLQGEKWGNVKELEGPFNKEGEHTGNGAYSPDGERFYFTRCKANWMNKMICTLYVSRKEDGAWQEPESLGDLVNSEEYTSSQPTVGTESKKNQEMVYFVSDRPGGKGGLDIWYTYYDKRKKAYRPAKNAGSKINTPGNEMTPWYDMETRTMYFSSDGWPNVGGLDIFKTMGEKNKFALPKNVGYPINSTADDLYYIIDKKNREKGYFVSNREGGVALLNPTCCDDIYSFILKDYIHLALKGVVLEAPDSLEVDMDTLTTTISDASVSLYMLDEEGEKVWIKTERADQLGEYFMKLEQGNDYQLVVERVGYFAKSFNFSTKDMLSSDTIGFNMYTSPIPAEPIVLKNIYYDFNKSTLTEQAKTTLDTTLYEILMENPKIIVEIGSHTDNKGSDTYNQNLSQKRAESAVKYLVEKGIPKERLIAKGYGESQPIAPNQNEDGTDNPDGRQKNRRTEFKILGELDEEIIYDDDVFEEDE